MGIFEFEPEEIALNTETQQWKSPFPDFHDNLLFGYFFKDIVIVLLDESGYEVYPFGYESFFPTLKRQIYSVKASEVQQRVRSAPDLLVRNPSDQQVQFVEVKSRSTTGRWGLRIDEVKLYHKFWPESILILVVPSDNYFYAQHVNKLPQTTGCTLGHFRPLEELFPLTKELTEEFRKRMVKKAQTLFRNRDFANL
jgi:hypothetical protein